MPRNVTVTFGDGSSHVYNGVPDDATPQAVEARASKDFGKAITNIDGGTPNPDDARAVHESRLAQAEAELKLMDENKPGAGTKAWEILKNFVGGVGETALNLGTATVATPIAGAAGALTAAATAPFIGRDKALEKGTGVVSGISNALTYQPRTETGQAAQENIAKPFEMLAGAGDEAGQVVTDVTGSEALGALTNTAVQAAPAVVLRKGGVKGRVTEAPIKTTPMAETAVQKAATAAEGSTPAASTPPPKVAPAPPPTAAPVKPAAVETPAVKKAKAYVADTLGMDWNAVSSSVQKRLTSIAETAKGFEGLDAQAVAREAKFGSLAVPVPATRGVLERHRGTLLNENNAASTKAGQPIADVHAAANQALLDNLDALRGKVSGTGKTAATGLTREQAGTRIQEAARDKLQKQKDRVSTLYKEAEAAGELQGQVSTRGLVKLLDSTPDTTHLGYVEKWLNKMDVSAETGPASKGKRLTLSLKEMEDLRQDAVSRAMNPAGGPDKHYASKVIKAIDEATEGTGGIKYKEARAARRAQALEFEDQGAVADLVDNASRTDRATALEKTVKTITNGSLEDTRKVKRTLLTGGDATTRTAGRQAWRELRRQVVDDIKKNATKGVAPLKDGSPNLTPGGLKSAIDALGPDKINEIFGSGTAKQLNRILEVTQDAKTIPPTGGAAVGSTTAQQLINFLEKGLTKGLDKIPLVGKLGGAGVQAAVEIAAERTAVKKATTTPLNEALAKAAGKARKDKVIRKTKEAAQNTTPLSQIGAQSQPRS